MSGGVRWLNNVFPKLKVIVEDIAVSGVFVATAYDEEGAYLCDGACCCAEHAIARCMNSLPEWMPKGRYDVTIDVLSPNDGDDSDADY